MKNLFTLILLAFICHFSYAQTSSIPDLVNFQGIARDVNGALVVNSNIQVRFTVVNDSSAQQLYREQHITATDAFGSFRVSLGDGLAAGSGFPATSLRQIAWEEGNKWVKIEYQTAIGPVWTEVATVQCLSSFYAFASRSAETLLTPATQVGQVLTWDGSQWAARVYSGVPTGTIIAYAGNTPPAGWLLCDGNTVSQNQYPDLFLAIGTSWGVGNGTSGSFNLPDLRGIFLRGRDGGAGRDPDATLRSSTNNGGATGDQVGSYQNDELKNHTHVISPSTSPTLSGTSYDVSSTASGGGGGVTGASGGNETRPKNAYVLYIIKI